MSRSRVGSVLLTAALLSTLAACGGKDDTTSDLPTLTPEPTESSSPTPTPTRPTAVPTQTTEKYRDLTLVLNRPAKVDPKAEIPVRLFLEIHQDIATMASGQPQPATMAQIAEPRPITFWNGVLSADKKARQRSGGTLVVNVTKVQGGAAIAGVTGCFDQTKLITIRSDGSTFVDPTVTRDPRTPVVVTFSKATGIWKITDYAFGKGSC